MKFRRYLYLISFKMFRKKTWFFYCFKKRGRERLEKTFKKCVGNGYRFGDQDQLNIKVDTLRFIKINSKN